MHRPYCSSSKCSEPVDLTTTFHLATRCDSSIVKLSGDMHLIRHEHQQIEKTIQELMSAVETVSKNLDMKVTENSWNTYIMCYCQKSDQHSLSKCPVKW